MVARGLGIVGLAVLAAGVGPGPAFAHHILGKPAYSYTEDGSTPPSAEIDALIGKYSLTMMSFPAFPKPGKEGRISLYARRLDNGKPFDGIVKFTVRDDSWFAPPPEPLGAQRLDGGVFRQGFIVSKAGAYFVTATFESDGEPYIVDFPLQVGQTWPVVPVMVAGGIVLLVLGGVSAAKRRRR
ncbi:MAG: hypothetical protein HQL37_07190 [Alphaproteobacteria bacterium]|nr:hypothetical protein [Alphaproteobacteria bacterium]